MSKADSKPKVSLLPDSETVHHDELLRAGHELEMELDAKYKTAIFFTACASAYTLYMFRRVAKEIHKFIKRV